MQDVQLTVQKPVKQVVDGVIQTICACFDDRILSIYLGGSLNREQMTHHSDLDMTVVFREHVSDEEYTQFMKLREGLQLLSPVRLDVWAASESKLKIKPASAGLRASQCLYGEDFWHSVPAQSIDYFAMQSIHKAIHYMTVLRGRPEHNPFPLTFPNPDAMYFGYTQYGDFDGEMRFKVGTRIIVDMLTRCTTALVAIQAGIEAETKQHSLELYIKHIGGQWADFVQALYELIKMDLQYKLPADAAEQRALHTLLEQLLAFENDALAKFKPVILDNLRSDNRYQRKLAVVALKNIQFHDEDIVRAVNALDEFDDEQLLESVKSKLRK